jgi:hypothetical protein
MNDEGKYIFTDDEGRVIDPRVIDNVRKTLQRMNMGKMIDLLMNAEREKKTFIRVQARLGYQDLIYRHLCERRRMDDGGWQCCEVDWTPAKRGRRSSSSSRQWTPLRLSSNMKKAGIRALNKIPLWKDLEKNVLVYPEEENYPFADLFYRNDDDELVVLQVWFGLSPTNSKEIKLNALNMFLDKLGLTMESPVTIKLYFFAPHSKADAAVFKISDGDEDDIEIFRNKIGTYWVVKPPEDYSAAAAAAAAKIVRKKK